MNKEIEKIAYDHECSLIGFANLKNIDEAYKNNYFYGISIGIALNPNIISGIAERPTMEYWNEYKEVNKKLNFISKLISDPLFNREVQLIR